MQTSAHYKKPLWLEHQATPLLPATPLLRPIHTLTEQDTLPLNLIGIQSALSFQHYLKTHHLEPLAVARVSGVRYLTIWNVQQGKPIRREHALLIRRGLQKLTGLAYVATIAVHAER